MWDPIATKDRLFQQWREHLASPDVRAGIAQAGLQMLQPMQPGQTLLGSLGQAVGTGMETVDARRSARNQATLAADKSALDREQLQTERDRAAMDRLTESERLALQGRGTDLEAQRVDIAREGLGIDRTRAEADLIRAQRSGRTLSGMTPQQVAAWRDKAHKAYQKEKEAYELLEDEDLNPGDEDAYVERYLEEIGIDLTAGPAPAGGPSPPAPANLPVPGPGAGGPPQLPATPPAGADASGAKPSFSQVIASDPTTWETWQAMLRDPDPKIVAAAKLRIERLRSRISDPQSIPVY